MKRLFAILLCLMITVCISSVCFAANSPIADELITSVNIPSIEATVISSSYNAEKDRFSFCAVADLSEHGYPNSTAGPFTFGVARENYINQDSEVIYDTYCEGDEIEPGTVVKIFWGGEFMESYPMQLGTVNFVIDTGDIYKFADGEYEEYYLMFYVELPDELPNLTDNGKNTDIDAVDDEVEEDINPSTGFNPMNIVLTGAAFFGIATILIYVLTTLFSKTK